MDEQQPQAGDQNAAHNPGEQTQSQDQTQEPKKVAFSDEQQAKIQELIDQQYSKAYAKAEEKYKPMVDSLNAKLASLEKAQKKSDETPQAEKPAAQKKEDAARDEELSKIRGQLDEFKTLSEQLKADRDAARQELQTVTERTRETRRKEAFLDAAKDTNFFDPLEVFRLVNDEIDLDDNGQVYVKNLRTGAPRLNQNLEPMTVKELLVEFRKNKPYMVRASDTAGGTGAQQSTRTETRTTHKRVSEMNAEEFEAYRQEILNR